MAPIGSIGSTLPPVPATSSPSQTAPAAGFGESLSSIVNGVDTSTGEANAAVNRMLTGQGDVYEAMMALQRAEMTLQLTVQVRNKFVQAYQDIMRMPV